MYVIHTNIRIYDPYCTKKTTVCDTYSSEQYMGYIKDFNNIYLCLTCHSPLIPLRSIWHTSVHIHITRRIQTFQMIESAKLLIQAQVISNAALCCRAFRMLLLLLLDLFTKFSYMIKPPLSHPNLGHSTGFLLKQESNLKLMALHSRHFRTLHLIIYSPWYKSSSDLQPQCSWCVLL